MSSVASAVQIVGVVGAGAMGRGIAQVAALGGLDVVLYDSRPGAVKQARDFIASMIARMVDKGTLKSPDADAAVARLALKTAIQDLSNCDVVIEAVVEDLAVKQRVFADLEKVVSPSCILASNTSSLSITTIASACTRPERVAGMHFFNPVPLMRLVEIISGVRTDERVTGVLTTLARRMGREPVQVADTPGFLVNQVGRGYTIEAAHIVAEGIADFVTVDRIMRESVGFRMGPFELMDLTGLDVTHQATEQIFAQFYGEPRFRPAGLMRARMLAGILGRKSKRGFHFYEASDATAPPVRPRRIPDELPPVWISSAEPQAQRSLGELLGGAGVTIENGDRPSSKALCLVSPVGTDCTTAAVDQGLDATRTVAVDTIFGFARHVTLMSNPLSARTAIDAAAHLFSETGRAVSIIRDSPGFVAQRIIAMIVNIAAEAAQQGTASPVDVDKAVVFGLAYPKPPLAGFGDGLGAATVERILRGIHDLYLDPRYRPSVWLTRRARLGMSLGQYDESGF